MKRSLFVTLEVEFEDLSKIARKEAAALAECKVSALLGLADATADDMGDLIAGSLPDNEELFAGSEIYAGINAARCIRAEWEP